MFQVDWCPRSDVHPRKLNRTQETQDRKGGWWSCIKRHLSREQRSLVCLVGPSFTIHPYHMPCCAVPVNLRARESTKGGQTRYEVTWLPPTGDARWNPPLSRPATLLGTCILRRCGVNLPRRLSTAADRRVPCANTIRPTTDGRHASPLPPTFPESLSLPALHKKTLAHFFHMPRFPAASLPARARDALQFSSTWTCHQLPLGSRKRQAATWPL